MFEELASVSVLLSIPHLLGPKTFSSACEAWSLKPEVDELAKFHQPSAFIQCAA